jgi:hypothetical protein
MSVIVALWPQHRMKTDKPQSTVSSGSLAAGSVLKDPVELGLEAPRLAVRIFCLVDLAHFL